jgi:hypothetical protein
MAVRADEGALSLVSRFDGATDFGRDMPRPSPVPGRGTFRPRPIRLRELLSPCFLDQQRQRAIKDLYEIPVRNLMSQERRASLSLSHSPWLAVNWTL